MRLAEAAVAAGAAADAACQPARACGAIGPSGGAAAPAESLVSLACHLRPRKDRYHPKAHSWPAGIGTLVSLGSALVVMLVVQLGLAGTFAWGAARSVTR